MDDKRKKTADDKSTELDEGQESTTETTTAEAEARSTILEIIELAGTHTTATDTEAIEAKAIENRKHVSFKDSQIEEIKEENNVRKNDENLKVQDVQKKGVWVIPEEKRFEQKLERVIESDEEMMTVQPKNEVNDTRLEIVNEKQEDNQSVFKKFEAKEQQKEQRWALVSKPDKVKYFVQELESIQEREVIEAKCEKMQQLAKKRKMDANKQELEKGDSFTQEETAKRSKRNDIENLSLDDIVIADLPELQELPSSESETDEQQQHRQQVIEEQCNSKSGACSDSIERSLSENQDIAERFKQIMEMFDNFTKNLESLEMSSTSEDNGPQRESSAKLSAIFEREMGANECQKTALMGEQESKSLESSIKKEHNNDYIIDIEDLKRPETEVYELSQLQRNTESTLPKWRQGLQSSPLMPAPARSCKDIATSTQLEIRTAEIVSVSCQTSLLDHGQRPHDATTQNTQGACALEHSQHFAALSVVLPPRNFEQKSNKSQQQEKELDSECRVETYIAAAPPPPSDTTGSKTPSPRGPNIGPSISRQNFVKVSESPSMLELPIITQPYTAERTFHTIHIDTTSSPSSSVMRRPPLGLRCWHVVTDLFNAICVCLQVNKDCIFCIGFFVAFVVSASFLTAFFYRTLSITPQFFHPTPPSALQMTATGFRDTGFYYY